MPLDSDRHLIVKRGSDMVLTVTASLATSNFKQVEETAGVKVSAKTGFSFLGAANELGMEAECQLKMTTNTMTSTQGTTSTTIQRQYTGRQAPSRSHLVPRGPLRAGGPERAEGRRLDHPQPGPHDCRRLPAWQLTLLPPTTIPSAIRRVAPIRQGRPTRQSARARHCACW